MVSTFIFARRPDSPPGSHLAIHRQEPILAGSAPNSKARTATQGLRPRGPQTTRLHEPARNRSRRRLPIIVGPHPITHPPDRARQRLDTAPHLEHEVRLVER